MRGIRLLVLLAAVCSLTACRSPFGSAPEDPEAHRVGRGVHGWPLYESAPHGPGWRTDVVWPAFSSIQSDEDDGLSSTKLLIPIFLFENEGERRRVGFLRPLWDLETEGDEVYDLDLLWPLVKWKDTPATQERRIAPLYFSKEGDDSGYFHLWPLYGRDWDGTREQQWILAPLLSHTNDPEDDVSSWDVPWPLVHFGTDGDARHVRFLPLLWHAEDGDEHQTVVFPFIWDFDDGNDSFEMVFPLYAKMDANDGDRARSILPPLYVWGRDGDEEYTWLLAPLVRWGAGETEWSAHAFPVVWIGRQDDGDGYTHLWPLFGWERYGDRREASTVFPFFVLDWDEDGWELDAPWPLVHFADKPGFQKQQIWPLYCNTERMLERDGEDVAHREGSVLLYLSNWESTGADERDFRILWKLVQRTRKAGKETFVVNPLFRHETNDDGDTYWSFLFGMIARKEEQGEVDWRFLWFL